MITMNIQEIIILNTALDGKQISFLPDFEKHRISSFLAGDVYSALITKEILEDKSTLTKQGAYLVKRISDFKEARKYVKLGSIVIAFKDSDSGVVLKHIPQKKQYYFERLNLKDSLKGLMEEYPFLRSDSTVVNDNEVEEGSASIGCDSVSDEEGIGALSFEDLAETYDLNFRNSIFISSFDKSVEEDSKVTNEVIFQSGNTLYLYDRDTKALAIKKANELQELLSRRLSA